MSSIRKPTTGERFGRLVVICPSVSKARYFECHCDCGQIKSVRKDHLIYGKCKSCGCGRVTHGLTRGNKEPPAYVSWRGMKSRCNNPNDKDYARYGGRGINVCERWNDFMSFFSDMGDPPFEGASIDRIDFNGNYEPSNCRWANCAAQNRNTSATRLTEESAAEIRKLHQLGYSFKSLSHQFGVAPATVQNVIEGKTWVVAAIWTLPEREPVQLALVA